MTRSKTGSQLNLNLGAVTSIVLCQQRRIVLDFEAGKSPKLICRKNQTDRLKRNHNGQWMSLISTSVNPTDDFFEIPFSTFEDMCSRMELLAVRLPKDQRYSHDAVRELRKSRILSSMSKMDRYNKIY